MKKFCLSVLSFVLAFTVFFPMSVVAASNKYHISELGLEITIPEGYTVITRDTPASDPIFGELGTTKTAIINQFEASNIYLNAISDSSNEEIVVTMTENMIDNFSLLSDTTLDVLATTVVNQYSDYGIDVSDYEIYHHSQAKFIKVYFTDTAKTVHGVQYYTVYDGKAMNFTMRSYAGSLSSRQETAIKTTVDSIFFDNAPPLVEEGEDTEAFVYTDPDSSVEFTVPANWKQKEFYEEREVIDVKFVSTKEDGCAMIFGSVDMWEQMSAIDRLGYSRSDINNSAFTKQDVAEIYSTTVDKISMVTYNGVQYFSGEINTSSDVYGIDISVTMTQLVYIDNGWMYMFQFNGTSAHKLYSDFEKLLNSVKYPAVSNVEATEASKPTTSVPDHSKQNSSQNTSENISQNSSSDSKDNSVVIAVVVLLVIVPAIVAAVVVTRKKNTETTNQSSYLTNNNVPVTKPVSDSEQIITCKKCDQTQPYVRNKNRRGGFLMKVLIWFLCIFANVVVTTLIRESGFILGGIPTAVLFGATFWLARTLCKKWDEHKETKAERKKQTSRVRTGENGISIGSPVEAGSGNNLSATSGWQCSCGRVHPTYETACVCGKSKFDNKLEQPQPNAAAEVTNKIRFCRKCGEKLIDESRFCRKCGTQVVEVMASPE